MLAYVGDAHGQVEVRRGELEKDVADVVEALNAGQLQEAAVQKTSRR